MPGDRASRSEIMRAVKSENTGPERALRSLLHRMGFRFRLHRVDLPGKPDLVLPKWRVCLFVHGCFWHGHDCARGDRVPKENREYWLAKVGKNRARDSRVRRELRRLGWRVVTVWECRLAHLAMAPSSLAASIRGRMASRSDRF